MKILHLKYCVPKFSKYSPALFTFQIKFQIASRKKDNRPQKKVQNLRVPCTLSLF